MMPNDCQPLQESKPKIIAAIPCFNTESSIVDVVSKAKKHVDHVIVIDCSLPPPLSPEEAESALRKGIL